MSELKPCPVEDVTPSFANTRLGELCQTGPNRRADQQSEAPMADDRCQCAAHSSHECVCGVWDRAEQRRIQQSVNAALEMVALKLLTHGDGLIFTGTAAAIVRGMKGDDSQQRVVGGKDGV